MKAFAALALGSAVVAAPPVPAGIVVQVAGVTIGRGTLYLSLCRREEFATMRCARTTGRRVSRAGTVELRFTGVPPGTYAVLALHDVNGNKRLDRDPWGAPSEPVATSGPAAARLPSFERSAFRHAAATTRIRLVLR